MRKQAEDKTFAISGPALPEEGRRVRISGRIQTGIVACPTFLWRARMVVGSVPLIEEIRSFVLTNPNNTSGGFTGTSERRAHPRCRPQPFAYVKVGEHNGGIVMDASETGLQIAAANSLAPENIVRLSLQLNSSAGPVEAEARVVWLSESKKTGGFEFVSLTDEAREQIRNWLSGDVANAQVSGPKSVSTPLRDQRMAGSTLEARTNGADAEIRPVGASDHPPRE